MSAWLPPARLAQMEQLVSMTTDLPLATPSGADPRGFGLRLAQQFNPELRRFWFYEREILGYRAAYFWWPDEDLLLVPEANTQPAPEQDKLGALAVAIHAILNGTSTNACCP